jgi:hypothetical protein
VRVLFLALLLAQAAPVWWWTYFPSQDGPSHLYNAAVAAEYASTPLYREFYTLQFSPGGNLLAPLIQAALTKFLPPLLAEKLLITFCLTLFVLGFRYLVQSFAPGGEAVPLFGFVLAGNWFLHMGFWNFCLSLPLAFFARGCFQRGGRKLVFTSLVLLTYFAHLLAWAVLAVCVAWLWFFTHRGRFRLAACVLAPAPLAALFHAGGERTIEPGRIPGSLDALAVHLTGYLHSFSLLEWAAGVLALLVLLPNARGLKSSPLAWLSFLLALLSFLAPESYGTGTFIAPRVMIFATALFAAAAAAVSKPSRAAAAVFAICAIAMTAARQPGYREGNRRIAAYRAFAAQLPQGSRVLPLNAGSPGSHSTGPLLHALGYESAKRLINLRNYEAGVDYFLVRFRPEKSPYGRLGTNKGMEKNPPEVDLSSYEWIDYVLVQGDYRVAHPRFELAAESLSPLTMRLYRARR